MNATTRDAADLAFEREWKDIGGTVFSLGCDLDLAKRIFRIGYFARGIDEAQALIAKCEAPHA